MIELRNVSKTYKQKRTNDVKALDDVSVKFNGTGLTFIIGPSGSGKSTLLNVIGSLDKIDSGEIIVDGLEISKLKEKELNLYRNNHIGFIFQDYNLLSDYNVHDNIDIALELQGKSDDDKISDILASVGLKGLNLRRIDELSGGEKQRVAIARALVKEPKIILADEPTGNLDSKTSIEIINILKEISKDHEVIVVSHNKELARKFGNRIIEISDGKVVKDTGVKGKVNTYEINRLNKNISIKKLFKLSLTNLWNSRKKAFFSVILLAMSLMFMAFVLNISIYDVRSDAINTMVKNDEYFLEIGKYSIDNNEWPPLYDLIIMNEHDIEFINRLLPYNGNPHYYMNDSTLSVNFIYGDEIGESRYYDGTSPILEEILNENMIGEYIGNIPSNSREIMITNYRAEAFMKYGVLDADDVLYKPSSFEKLLEEKRKIKFGNDLVTIVGIVMNDNHQYDTFKKTEIFDTVELEGFRNNYGIQNEYVFVKGFTKDATRNNSDKNSTLDNETIRIYGDKSYAEVEVFIDDNEIEYYNSNGEIVTGKIKDKELIIPFRTMKELDDGFNKDFNAYRESNPTLTYTEAFNSFFPNYIKNNKKIFSSEGIINLGFSDENGSSSKIDDIKIVGVSLTEKPHISSDILKYASVTNNAKAIGIKIYEKDIDALKRIYSSFDIVQAAKNDDLPYYISFRYSEKIRENLYLYTGFKWIIVGILIVSSLFALAMLYNLIKTNIIDSKAKIGTLKALGMNNKSSLLIFVFEYVIIDIISWILGIILWILMSMVFNVNLIPNTYVIHDMIILESIIIVYILVYVVVLSNIALVSILHKINNIKPIDAILKRETK